MNYRVGAVLSADEVIKDANYADIREFCTPEVVSRTPHADLTGGEWKVCTPETVKGFSAVAYFFARALHLDKMCIRDRVLGCGLLLFAVLRFVWRNDPYTGVCESLSICRWYSVRCFFLG